MALHAVCARAREPTLEHGQTANPIDVKLLPATRRSASTLAADLKAEQALNPVPDPVVVRLDDSRMSRGVHELDETLVSNRACEFVVQGIASP